MRLFILLKVLLVFAIGTAQAQSSSDGSVYSRFGLGELNTFISSQAQAMGGVGIGSRSFTYVNYSNPASWSDQILTRASAGFNFYSISISDAADNVSRLTTGTLAAIQFSFPIKERKLGVGLSFAPYSRMNYRVQEEGELITDQKTGEISTYEIKYEGSGGLQEIKAGLGYRVNSNLSVGVNANIIFGIIKNGRRTSFIDDGFSATNVATSTRLHGISGTLGALLTLPNFLKQDGQLSIGAALSLPTTLQGTRVNTIGAGLDSDTLGVKVEGNLDLPLGLGVGLAYYSGNNRWILLFDSEYEPWSRFTSEFNFPGYTPTGTSNFSDKFRIGGGFEFLPAGSDLLASFFRRTGYRLGFYYDQAYVSPDMSVDLKTLAVTGGLSLPALYSGTRLDINIEVGTRGTTDRGLVRDMFYKFSVNVNIGERWFQRQQLR